MGALSPVTSAFMPSIGDGSAGSTRSATAPSGAPKGGLGGRDTQAGAPGQIGNTGVARRPPSACEVGMCLAQSTAGGEGAPGYEIRNDGTGGGVPVEQNSPILDWLVSRIAPEVAAVINIVVALEEHRAAWTAVHASARGTPKEAQKKVLRDQGPRDIERIDEPEESVPGSQWHAHQKKVVKGKKPALNQDGSFHDGEPSLSAKTLKWLRDHGWNTR
jgi:hypothetical protein